VGRTSGAWGRLGGPGVRVATAKGLRVRRGLAPKTLVGFGVGDVGPVSAPEAAVGGVLVVLGTTCA
jgi:hypothetical protein